MRAGLIVAAAWLLSANPAAAQPQASRATRDYVQDAGNTDAFERYEAYTVLAQSTDPQVLAFARQMIADHDQTTRTLQQATAKAGIAPPPGGVSADEAGLLGGLQSARGPDQTRLYWIHQALQHRAALVMTQLYASSGDDPAIRRVAASAVPIIAGHLAMAEQMVAQVPGS